MGARLITKLPSDFVEYLRNPGLDTKAGRVPLTRYMSLKKGNKEIDSLVVGLRSWKLKNAKAPDVDKAVGYEELNLIWKGQGYPPAFVSLMNFLCDNQEGIRDAGGDLTKIYDKYFKENRDVNALTKMAEDKYFGIECIGFVSNFLRHVGLWDKYYGYEIDQWDRVFKERVPSLASVRALNLLIWPASHIALVDHVHSVSGDTADIDLCQSANAGPQCHEHVTLKASGAENGIPRYAVMGGNPAHTVVGTAYLMNWPELHYVQAARPATNFNGAGTRAVIPDEAKRAR